MKRRPLTVVQTFAAADVGLYYFPCWWYVQGGEQFCARFPKRRWYQQVGEVPCLVGDLL
jgi:hypothetical protein